MSDLGAVSALLDYPMFVVTTACDGERSGCLVGFATQTSVDPARFLVGVSVNNHTHRVVERAGRIVVHLLDAESTALARLFGEQTGDDTDKFAECGWSAGPDEVPVLDEAVAWFSGPIRDRIPAGDHTAVLIDVDGAEVRRRPGRLLGFSDVRDFDPGHDA